MRVTVQKKTDQLNFEDFLGGIARTVTIAGVKEGTREQQYDISIEGDKRAWRPPPTVLKLLIEAWGDEAKEWVGRRARLYGDPDVMFGGKKIGGIRVSNLSHIDKPVTANLSVTRGKREMFTVDPLPDETPAERVASLRAEWKTADPDRRKVIEAEVNAPSADAQPADPSAQTVEPGSDGDTWAEGAE